MTALSECMLKPLQLVALNVHTLGARKTPGSNIDNPADSTQQNARRYAVEDLYRQCRDPYSPPKKGSLPHQRKLHFRTNAQSSYHCREIREEVVKLMRGLPEPSFCCRTCLHAACHERSDSIEKLPQQPTSMGKEDACHASTLSDAQEVAAATNIGCVTSMLAPQHPLTLLTQDAKKLSLDPHHEMISESTRLSVNHSTRHRAALMVLIDVAGVVNIQPLAMLPHPYSAFLNGIDPDAKDEDTRVVPYVPGSRPAEVHPAFHRL